VTELASQTCLAMIDWLINWLIDFALH
jgi:hypothetical protein